LRYSNFDIGQKLLKDSTDWSRSLALLEEKQDNRVEDNSTIKQKPHAKFWEQKKELKAIKADPKHELDSQKIW